MYRRPALIPVLHRIWIAFAAAVLLASCTVVPTPTGYSYQQTACPPGVGAPGAVPPPETQNAPPPSGDQQPAPPPQAQGAPGSCYTAVPNSYTYSYYPGYAYPYAYPAPAYYPYGYPYYAPYYGPSIGIGFGFGYRHHHHW